jgi:hypothetical protein
MKSIVTIRIDANDSRDLKEAQAKIGSAIEPVRLRLNGGTHTTWSITNADNPQALMSLFGQIKWWSLGKGKTEGVEAQKRKGFWSKLGDELRETIWTDEDG